MSESAADTRLGCAEVQGTRVDRLESIVGLSFLRSTIGDNTWPGSQRAGDRTVRESREFLFLRFGAVTAIRSLGREFISSSDEGEENEDRDELELRVVHVGELVSNSDVVRVGGVRRQRLSLEEV